MIKFNRRFNPAQIQLLIFDLDGTLIDSRTDLIKSVNAMLAHFGERPLPGDVIASYVGDGVQMLVRRALAESGDEKLFQAALQYFLSYYYDHKLDHTRLYEGIAESLQAIRAFNGKTRTMAVLSNKPVNPCLAIAEALGIRQYFLTIYGGNSFNSKKPDPAGVNSLLKDTQLSPEQAVIIGDSSIDVLTGRNSGIWTCGVTYGFSPETLQSATPDVLVDTTAELGELFSSATAI